MLHHILHSAGWYNIATKNAHDPCPPGGEVPAGNRKDGYGSLMKQLVLGYFWTTTRLSGSGYVGFCLPFTCVAGPTCGVHPFGTVTGGVDVEGDEDDVWHEIPGQAGDDGEMAGRCRG